ncbi:MAG: Plug domain-containing protein, partial [Dysgonamonadaceae bacterium]|nr:Plug domain-containing protein [Dysgonamonadaceae bacterium]
IDLPEVEVRAQKIEKKKNFSIFMPDEIKGRGDMFNAEQIEKFNATDVADVLKHFLNLRIVETDDGMRKVIINQGASSIQNINSQYAALIIDDVVLNNYDLESAVNPEDIEKVAVLKPGSSKSILLGSEGFFGAIVIETKKGASFTSNRSPSFNKQSIRPLGIQQPAEFYSPTYEKGAKLDAEHPDFRTTIYWNPNVELSETGEAKLLFHAADTHSQYSVIIEGLLSNGKIIYNFNKIVVE